MVVKTSSSITAVFEHALAFDCGCNYPIICRWPFIRSYTAVFEQAPVVNCDYRGDVCHGHTIIQFVVCARSHLEL